MKLKERRRIAKAFRKLREAFEQEDRALRDAQDTRSRAEKRREDKAARQAEAAARRAEARRLAQEEEKGLQKTKKLTAVELRMQREKDLREVEKMGKDNERNWRRVVTEKEYEKVILVVNENRRYVEDDDDCDLGD